METQKIINLLNGSDNENSKFATKTWYIIDNESKGYSHHNPIRFLTKSIESSLCDCSDTYILVTGNIYKNLLQELLPVIMFKEKQPLNAATQLVFKNCAPFKKCFTEIDGTLVDETNLIEQPMYILIEYSDRYCDTSGSLQDFKRDETVNNANVTNDDNAPSFKYRTGLIGNTETNGTKNGVKIAVPLKYLSNIWRSLEMPLINCKIELSSKQIENCVLTSAAIGADAQATGADSATFKITDAKLHVLIVILSAEDNVKLSKLFSEGFKRSIYWSKYKVIDNILVEIAVNNGEKYIRELSSY